MRPEYIITAAAALVLGVPLALMAPGALPQEVDPLHANEIIKVTPKVPCATKSAPSQKANGANVMLTCS